MLIELPADGQLLVALAASCVRQLSLRPHRLARGDIAGWLRAAAWAGRPVVLTLAAILDAAEAAEMRILVA